MVDKALFLGSNGESSSMSKLERVTNNLANVNTTGFRADYESMKQYQAGKQDQDNGARTFTIFGGTYSDFTPGPVVHTDRDLDIAMQGKGFIAVQSKSGKEGYTRAGDLQLNTKGFLTTRSGEYVMGTNGPIQITQAERMSIGEDGTVSALIRGETDPIIVNRIKLTSPDVTKLQKGTDGLFYLTDGGSVKQDLNMRIVPGALEGSNVNPVQTLTTLIELSRQFQMHSSLVKSLEENATKANQILSLPT